MRFDSVRLVMAAPVLAAGLMAASFPDPSVAPAQPAPGKATIVLAGGCFWGVEGVFEHVKGVTETQVGYSGGSKQTAHYERIEQGDTGHAESVKVTYDPSKVSLGQLLKIYFSVAHDPTTLNRQHNDVGTQYRSAIFYGDEQQKKFAESYIKQLNDARVFRSPIVTQVTQLQAFYPAEPYHQKYMDRCLYPAGGDDPTCYGRGYIQAMDVPLIENLKRTYPDLYKR